MEVAASSNRTDEKSSTMAGSLETYRRKRDFRRTPEPKGRRGGAHKALQYVVQKHDATRLHYDFRLEHAGVLKSWAVPKEPSYDPKDRRLAVQTEDHPLAYATFEGEIPEPEYGAGTVVIWDRGRWEPLGDPDRGLADGKLDFRLHGERLEGRWTLVRMARRGARKRPDNWLLIKRSDAAATRKARPSPRRNDASEPRPRGDTASRKAAPHRTRGAKRKPKRRGAAAKLGDVAGAHRAPLPAHPAPQLATLVNALPAGADWLYEPKLDGYRLLCRVADGRVALLTRRGNDWTDRFALIAAAARTLPCESALLDGEAVVFDERGLTSFQRLQNAIASDDHAIVLVAFDLLYLDGWDLRGAPLRARKERLHELLAAAPEPLRYGEHVEQHGAAFFREACKLGLEGIVAKRAADPYRGARTNSWLKLKCLQRQEFVIVAFTEPKGSRTGFGALLLGTRERAGEALRYVGKVGTGFDEPALRALKKRLDTLRTSTPRIERSSVRGVGRAGVHWVEPELVAEISYGEWTADGRLRHPVFLGLREDKSAAQVVAERAHPEPAREGGSSAGSSVGSSAGPFAQPSRGVSAARSTAPSAGSAAALSARSARPQTVKLTNPDRVLFPDPGITKRELARYWEQVADIALPSIANRPLTLYRCPEGYTRQCFYQKHVGVGVPNAVARVVVDEDEEPYAMIDGLPALLGLVQVGVLEIHVWGSRAENLDQPDVIVLDLDPAENVRWSEVVDAAMLVEARLRALGLRAFLRLTGGKGLHLVVPVVPGPQWPAIKKFTRTLVNEIVRDEPKRFTGNMAKSARDGKIFIDYLRNDREATAIASYSPRARAGAPVALPIPWDELDRTASAPPRFSLLDVPAVVRARKRDPWEGFEQARSSLVD
jgi:bifunctional non-homologous end joining protein LigD